MVCGIRRCGSWLTTDGDDDEIVEVSPPRVGDYAGWAYVGSHNFTPSAWGTLSGSSFNPVLNVRRRREFNHRFMGKLMV